MPLLNNKVASKEALHDMTPHVSQRLNHPHYNTRNIQIPMFSHFKKFFEIKDFFPALSHTFLGKIWWDNVKQH